MGGNSDMGDATDSKKIHPFFSGPRNGLKGLDAIAARPVTPDPSCSPTSDKASASEKHSGAVATAENEDGSEERTRKRLETNDRSTENKLPAKKRGRPPGSRSKAQSVAVNNASHVGENTTCLGTGEPSSPHKAVDGDNTQPDQAQSRSLGFAAATTNDSMVQAEPPKPQTVLRFNPKTGTIGPPPKLPQPSQEVAVAVKPAVKSRRGRKPASAGGPAPSCVVCISYGSDEDSRQRIAEAIEDIYSRDHPTPSSLTTQTDGVHFKTKEKEPALGVAEPPRKPAVKDLTSQAGKKPTHPFFSNKPKPTSKSEATPASTATSKDEPSSRSSSKSNSIFTTTPCSPKQTLQRSKAKFNVPHFGLKSGVLKTPGAQDPAWPWKGMVHIYGDDRDEASAGDNTPHPMADTGRKAKETEVSLPANESVLSSVTASMGLEDLANELKSLNTDEFQAPPSTLRIPGRHFESGKKLQARVRPELRTWRPGSGQNAHSAITNAYDSLTSSRSAFDQSKCETTSWTQKYAPLSAAQVLQCGNEAEMLRDWLQTLKIMSVDKGSSEALSAKTKQGTSAKKMRKRKRLDNFVVSSDEDPFAIDDVSETEADWLPDGGQGGPKKTVVRTGTKDKGRLANTVVISGPHGCGKTATVHAIAKELDFEIFEINPGARRSGKDILEKIGDMTRNHLVQHQQDNTVSGDAETPDDEVVRDLKSGKQGMMTKFFKPKTDVTNSKSQQPPANPSAANPTKKLNSKGQKQSLILLEEVDILYEEDKQFWNTVISLMVQSKRPFILTCNEENLVPLHTLNLHGIFRLSKPPKDQAVDLLLLIAANEGHALRRQAVEALFDSRHHDLRASITELNYWCQIGIGDAKGGFGWIYRRWPAGADVDEEGNTIRVVSTDTYKPGMGWLGRDSLLAPSAYFSVEDEVRQQTWDCWGLDTESLDLVLGRTSTEDQSSGRKRLEALEAVDDLTDSLSLADACSFGSYSSHNDVTINPELELPDLPGKEDFVVGRRPLDAEPLTHYDPTSLHIAASIKRLARRRFSSASDQPEGDSLWTDDTATETIRHSFAHPPYEVPTTTRYDFSIAFDPLAEGASHPGGYLDPSVFDRTMKMITLDVAPYVRGIVAYDQQLQKERLSRSNLLSEGGKPKKRMRTTRAAYSAMEGGVRASTRREKYFTADVNPVLVMRTGGRDWGVDASGVAKSEQQDSRSSLSVSADESMDMAED